MMIQSNLHGAKVELLSGILLLANEIISLGCCCSFSIQGRPQVEEETRNEGPSDACDTSDMLTQSVECFSQTQDSSSEKIRA